MVDTTVGSRWKSFRPLIPHAKKIDVWLGRKRKADAQIIISIGKELTAARAKLAKYRDGVFGRWRRDVVGMTESTARRYMSVYHVFGVDDVCAKLAQSFQASALYVLSENGVPKAAIEEALAIANTGGIVTHRQAKWLIQNAFAAAAPADYDHSVWDEGDDSDADDNPTKYATVHDRKFRKRKTDLEILQTVWERISSTDRKEFIQWAKARRVEIASNAKTGTLKVV